MEVSKIDGIIRQYGARESAILAILQDIQAEEKYLPKETLEYVTVNLKNFLKGKARIKKVAQYVAEHYRENVEPLGYKAFLVAVDREACALYKKALDEFLPKAA